MILELLILAAAPDPPPLARAPDPPPLMRRAGDPERYTYPTVTYEEAKRRIAASPHHGYWFLGIGKSVNGQGWYGEALNVTDWPPGTKVGVWTAWLDHATGAPVWTPWDKLHDDPVEMRVPGVARPTATFPEFDPDHRCNRCGRTQYVVAGWNRDGTHNHVCPACGNSWRH